MSDPVIAWLIDRITVLERQAAATVVRTGTVKQASPLLVQLDDDVSTTGQPATKTVTVGALTAGQRVRVEVGGGVDRLVVARLT